MPWALLSQALEGGVRPSFVRTCDLLEYRLHLHEPKGGENSCLDLLSLVLRTNILTCHRPGCTGRRDCHCYLHFRFGVELSATLWLSPSRKHPGTFACVLPVCAAWKEMWIQSCRFYPKDQNGSIKITSDPTFPSPLKALTCFPYFEQPMEDTYFYGGVALALT